MPGSYVKIQSVTVTSATQAAMEFTSIPGTFDDLLILFSARFDNSSGSRVDISFNGNTANFTNRYIQGNSSTASSGNNFVRFAGIGCLSTDTANVFANNSIYIPNYAGSTNKSYSADSVSEVNGIQAYQFFTSGLWSNTAAITSISLTPASGNFVTNSTAILYGIRKS